MSGPASVLCSYTTEINNKVSKKLLLEGLKPDHTVRVLVPVVLIIIIIIIVAVVAVVIITIIT